MPLSVHLHYVYRGAVVHKPGIRSAGSAGKQVQDVKVGNPDGIRIRKKKKKGNIWNVAQNLETNATECLV